MGEKGIRSRRVEVALVAAPANVNGMHQRGELATAPAAPNVDPARVWPRLADVQRPPGLQTRRHGTPQRPLGIRWRHRRTLHDPTPRNNAFVGRALPPSAGMTNRSKYNGPNPPEELPGA
jgi:hypothetical protein